jgi:carbonic anhydrase
MAAAAWRRPSTASAAAWSITGCTRSARSTPSTARTGRPAHEKEKLNRLCELNVIRQVRNVASDVFVQDAWARGQSLSVHGWVYSLSNGLVTDLNVGISSLEDYETVARGTRLS